MEFEFLEEDIKKVEELEGKDDFDLGVEVKDSEGEEEKEGEEKVRLRIKKVKKGRVKEMESCGDEVILIIG